MDTDKTEDKRHEVSRKEVLRSVQEPATPTTSKRRPFLRATIASALAAVGLAGTANAIDPRKPQVTHEELKRAESEYESRSAALDALRNEGAQLFAVLSENGYIAKASLDAFDLDTLNVTGIPVDGVGTAHITVQDGDGLTAVVQPQVDRAYAGIGSGSEATVVKASGEILQSCYNTRQRYQASQCAGNGADCDDTWALYCADSKIACCDDGSCFVQQQYDCYDGCCLNNDCYDVC